METKKMVTDWGIPTLRPDRLSALIPSRVYGGGAIENPADLLFLWRSCKSEAMTGGVVGFFVDDWRLESLWKRPGTYAKQFKACGVQALVEVDFSLWSDMSVAEQKWNVYRTRTVSRIFQSLNLPVIPNLSWSTEESFSFAFQGILIGAAICATECRTPDSCDEDRRRFLAGLARAVQVVQPMHILIYGGREHRHWLTGNLPEGPSYTLLESFMTARGRIRTAQERAMRDRNQMNLFSGGNNAWADAEVQAA